MELIALMLMLLLECYLEGETGNIENPSLVSSASCDGDCQSTPKFQQQERFRGSGEGAEQKEQRFWFLVLGRGHGAVGA